MSEPPKSREKRHLVVRTDGGTFGFGHLMRCLALAQSWNASGGQTTFITAQDTPVINARLRADGIRIKKLALQPGSDDDAVETASLADKLNAEWVVVDGYHFNTEYQRRVKTMKTSLMVIDDNAHARHYYADLILNQNFHASPNMYKQREQYTRLLLGPRYALLRNEFAKWRGSTRETPEVATRVLVTLGGAPDMGVVHMVIRVLQELEGVIRSIVVVGDHDDAKENFIGTDSRISLQSNVADMAEIMSHSDIAVSAGGSTCWELAFIGVPNIIIVLAENQESVARSLDEQGVAVNLGGYSSVDQGMLRHIIAKLMHDPAARMSMSEKGRRLVDGRGAERVTAILRETMQ